MLLRGLAHAVSEEAHEWPGWAMATSVTAITCSFSTLFGDFFETFSKTPFRRFPDTDFEGFGVLGTQTLRGADGGWLGGGQEPSWAWHRFWLGPFYAWLRSLAQAQCIHTILYTINIPYPSHKGYGSESISNLNFLLKCWFHVFLMLYELQLYTAGAICWLSVNSLRPGEQWSY